jgi:WG containing repeat
MYDVRVIGASRSAVRCRSVVVLPLLIFATALFVPAVRACSWSYLIWGLRGRSADPLFRFLRNGKAGYIDASGNVVIQPTLPPGGNSGGEFHEGLLGIKDEHGFSYLDRSGMVVFRSDAWLAFDFSGGLAPAARYAFGSQWGFIDRTGIFAIRPQYHWVDPFSEGLARVSVDAEVGSTGYIDSRGQFVIPPRLTYGASFHEDRAAVIIDGPCFITNGGSCERANFQPTAQNANYDCRYAFIDKTGKPISSLRFDDAGDFSEGLAPVVIDGQWGYVDRSGQISIPAKFQWAESFSDSLAAVRQDGKIGFIDHSGRFVIAPQFDAAESFSDGRALVSRNSAPGQWAYSFIDRNGNSAFPGEYSAATAFNYGLAHVATGRGRFSWINTTGKAVFSYFAQ